jgi:hypothetical protein
MENKGLRELYEDVDKVADIKKENLECTGHVERIDQGRRMKGLFESKPVGSRRRKNLD